jgi:hypothetical protein
MSLTLRSSTMKIGLAAAVVMAVTAGTVAGVAAASPPSAAAAAPIDHQLCYTAAANFPPPPVVRLKNQFSTRGFVPKIGAFAIHCNPVLKITPSGKFPIRHPKTHLACWTITEKTQPTPLVQVANQFGSAVLQPGQPNLLCLPSWKSLTGPPNQPTPQPGGLSHFTCYPILKTVSGSYNPPPVMLKDEFAPKPVSAQVSPVPQELCLPTQKTVIAKKQIWRIVNKTWHLLCFPVTPTPTHPAWDQNQFGTSALKIIRTQALCLPSTKTIVGKA